MRVSDQRRGRLVEALLRLYGGLFEEAATIDEARLARLIEKPVDEVEKLLNELDAMKVLSYRPRSDRPSATLLQPRQDAARLTLDPAALRDREQRAQQRLQAMLAYMRPANTCRMTTLLSYFDEPVGEDCGRCDVCRSRKSYGEPASTSAVAEPLAAYHRDIEEDRMRADELGKAPDTKGSR